MIYFIYAEQVERVKIGFTRTSVEKRLSELQCGSPVPLTLLAIIGGTVKHEQELHRLFKRFHVRGEWFEYHDEIKAFIAQIPPYSPDGLPANRAKRQRGRPFKRQAQLQNAYQLVEIGGRAYFLWNNAEFYTVE